MLGFKLYLTILDEAYVSKIAVLREANLQDCNPAQKKYEA